MKFFANLAVCLTLLCASCVTHQPDRPAHAQGNVNERHVIPRTALKWTCRSRFPLRGVVVGYGGILTHQANFYLVDFDRRLVRRIMVDWNPRLGRVPEQRDLRQVVWLDEGADVSVDELSPIIIRSQEIWRLGVAGNMGLQPLDSTPALVLLDWPSAFEDGGTATHAPDKTLSAAVYKLAQAHGLTTSRGIPSGVTCDPDQTEPEAKN